MFELWQKQISGTEEGLSRPKYILKKCGTNSYFFVYMCKLGIRREVGNM